MIVIGLLGRAGSGKSTAAKYLVETFGAKVFSFAAPLKDLTKLVFDFTEEQVRGTQAQKEAIDLRYGISPRTAMIRLGDGARQVIGERVWIDACFNQIAQSTDRNSLVVIEDVRYENEVRYIAGSVVGGYVIKLVCPDSDSTGYTNASSEKSVDEVPNEIIYAMIVSNKSPGSTDLKYKIGKVVSQLLRAEKTYGWRI